MKKSITILLTIALLFSMFATISAYEFPKSFWPVNDQYVKALNTKDNYGIIQYGVESIAILENEPVNSQTKDALAGRYEQVGVAYENLGMYEESAPYFQKLLQLQYGNSNITYGQIKLNTLRVQQYTPHISLYTDGGTTTHFGARGEKISGVLYGACVNGEVRNEIPNESMVLIYQELGDSSTIDFNKRQIENARESGIAVELALNCPQEGTDVANIKSYAAFLYNLSDVLKEYSDVVIYLRFGAEFDSWRNKTTASQFVQAYRYVSDIFRPNNPNVAMVWSPTVAPGWDMNINDYYPGDQYVDWVGVSLYASPYYQGNTNAAHMEEVYFKKGKNSDPVLALNEFIELYGCRKPIMISECGCGHHVSATGEDTTAFAVNYLKQYFGYLPMVYPQVKLMAYFDHKVYNDVDDYRLSSNPQLKETYLNYVESGVFAQDTFMDEADVVYRKIENNTYVEPFFRVSAYAHLYDQDVQSVTYFINDQYLDTISEPPFTAYLDVSKFSHKTAKLTAVAQGEKSSVTTEYMIEIAPMPTAVITVYVDNVRTKFDQMPITYNDRTMVPMRKIFEVLGASVSWDGEKQTITSSKGSKTIVMKIGSSVMHVNGKEVRLDTPPVLINGRTLVPVRAIAEGLGCNVEWNEKENAVYIEPKVYAWSDWVKKLPASVDEERYIIEEKVQYSYREKEYYESEYINPFEECIDEKKIYGRWSDWTRNVMYGRSDLQVESRTQSSPVYYRFTHYCTGNIADKEDRYCTAPSKFNEACDFHDLGWLDYKLDPAPDGKSGYVQYRSDGELKRCSNSCYRWYIADTKGGDYTEYRSREVTTIYTYERWGDWSDYDDVDPHDYIPRSDWNDIEVRTREFYRYKERA